MGTKSLMSVPGRQHFTMLPQIIVGGNKHILWGSAGRAPLDLVPSFFQTSPRVPFTFAEFAFAVINLSHHYDYMLSNVCPLSEPYNPGGG